MSAAVGEVLVSVGKTFAVMAIGFVFERRWGRDIEVLTDLSMKLFVPCLGFSVIVSQAIAASSLVTAAGAGALVILGSLAATFLLFRALKIRRRGLYLPVVFMNAANLPFPIIEANYGRAGLGYAVLYYLAVVVLLYTLGIAIVARSPDPRVLLKTPITFAVLAGLLVQALHVPVPRILLETTELIGGAALPSVLFIFGYSLGALRLDRLRLAAFGSVLRLLFGFGLGWLAVELFHVEGMARDVILLMSAMPSAVVTVVIARQYDADADIVASVVFLTSIASLVVIPVMLILLRA